jgi:hypothetical protein
LDAVTEGAGMTREKALETLKEVAPLHDREAAHAIADLVLCELLEALGYQDVVAAYSEIEKWCA